jgi:hypothetical protein
MLAATLAALFLLGVFAESARAADPLAAPAPGDRATAPVQPPGGADRVSRSRGPRSGDSRAPAPATGVSFLATVLSESGFIPPDTTGAVGDSSIIVPLNGRLKIFSKTGATIINPTLDTFFASVLPSGFAFDPRVEYDPITDRWFVIAVNGGANNTVMIATSNDSAPDAVGDFTFRSFVHSTVIPGDAGEFADYPTLGVDANSLLIGTNNFAGSSYNSSSLFVIDKSDLIGGTLTVTGFQNIGTSAGAGMFTPNPADNDDPAATESYVIGVDNGFFSRLDFRRVTYPGGTPTLGPEIALAVPSTTNTTQVPALGSTTPVDTTNDRLFEVMINRDPVSGQPRLWTAHNFEVNASGVASGTGNRVGSRWYEFGNLAGTPSLAQAGTLFDPAATNPDSYFFPAIAANGQGHALLGSSVAGPARFIGVALAQRFSGEPAGTLGPVNFAQPGAGSYTLNDSVGRNRWGDYSQVSVDPTNNLTWWAFQEYVNATNSWAVRVIEVPAPPPATPVSATVATPGSASTDVVVTGASSNGSAFSDPGPGSGIPNRLTASVTGGVVVNSITVNSPTQLTLNLNTTAAPIGLKGLTITNPDGQSVIANNVINVADVDPPETEITKQPKKKTESEKAKLKFESDEADSDFECKLKGKDVKKGLKQFKPCDSGKKKYKNLDPGKKKFQVRAIDAAGNVDPTPDKAKWKVLEE